MTQYRTADEVARIARDLIAKHHPHLEDFGVRIEYVFRDEAEESAGKIVWGKARRMTGLNAWLAGAERPSETITDPEKFFVIEIAEDIWKTLNVKERRALVDHELSHCFVDLDKDEQIRLKLLRHDIEEFRGVVKRHGLWREDVEHFAQVCLPLFDHDGSSKAAAK